MKIITAIIHLLIAACVMIAALDWATSLLAHTTWPRYLAQSLIILDTTILYILATLTAWHWMDSTNNQ